MLKPEPEHDDVEGEEAGGAGEQHDLRPQPGEGEPGESGRAVRQGAGRGQQTQVPHPAVSGHLGGAEDQHDQSGG